MIIGIEHVFQTTSHNYTTYKRGYKIIQQGIVLVGYMRKLILGTRTTVLLLC